MTFAESNYLLAVFLFACVFLFGWLGGLSDVLSWSRAFFRTEPGGEVRYVGPRQVSRQAASKGLRLLGVLDESGVFQALPACRATLPRLSPCWSPVLPRWAVDSDAKALLQAARAQRQATAVLEGDLRQWADYAARTNP